VYNIIICLRAERREKKIYGKKKIKTHANAFTSVGALAIRYATAAAVLVGGTGRRGGEEIVITIIVIVTVIMPIPKTLLFNNNNNVHYIMRFITATGARRVPVEAAADRTSG